MTPKQIAQLLPDAVEALTSYQINSLSKPQRYALEIALSDISKSKASVAPKGFPLMLLLLMESNLLII